MGFGDFHNTQAKLAPAQPFIGPQDGIRIAYPLQKRLNFYFFVTVIVKIVSLIYHFYTFFISKLGYIFALSFCFQLLDTSQASSAMLQSEMMVDCILFDQ